MKQIACVFILSATLVACGGSDPEVIGDDTNTGSGGSFTSTGVGSGSQTGTDTDADTDTAQTGTDTGTVVSPGTDDNSTVTPVSNTGNTVSSLSVSHRNGQTFIVWGEVAGARYHVYRHNSPITSNNLGSATLLTEKWGALGPDTSVNLIGNGTGPRNFVISDLDNPLGDDRGLFVHTTQSNQPAAYYAVTTVVGGSENRSISASNATSQAVREFVNTPRPVLTASKNNGSGRIYTQFMDYANWNPTLQGYAFNFAVALPVNYNPSQSYPLRVELHAHSESHKYVDEAEFDWPVIQLFPHDPGSSVGTIHSWWYGFAADHNYQTQGGLPASGTVENFTEQRVIAAINYLISDGQFNVDPNLVHAFGHSMGGSGSLSLGIRYPSVFAGIYASQPMVNYGESPIFQNEFTALWGQRSRNLPIVNNGANISDISNYGQGGSQATGVWNWMNHFEQLERRRGQRFAYLMVDHGKEDGVIDWPTQGRPVAQTFTDARVGFSAAAVGGVGHSWLSFRSIVNSVFGFGFDANQTGWLYSRAWSFPGIHFASGSGSLQPGNTGDDLHNTTIEWSTPRNNFHQNIVDTANRYEITLRSTAGNQTAHITPRNTNAFRPSAGTRCSWTARSNSNNSTIGSGNATVDGSQLLTVPGVQIVNGAGTRLAITCP